MSNVQDNAAHTCSYSCDRPECIKAQRDELAAAAAQETMAWTKEKPVVEGDYYVRGFNLFAPKQYEALVQVRMHHFDGEPAPELVCNLHESTSSEDMNDWSPIVEMSDDFEWRGPLYAAPVTAAPAMESMGKRKLIQLQGDGFIVNGVAIYNPDTGQRGLVDYLGYVGWQGTPAAPGIDLREFGVALIYAVDVLRSVGGANTIVANKIDLLIELIDASPKGGSEARDAARYRWLREFAVNGSIGIPFHGWLNCDEPASEWDSAIDAAMQAGDAEVQP